MTAGGRPAKGKKRSGQGAAARAEAPQAPTASAAAPKASKRGRPAAQPLAGAKASAGGDVATTEQARLRLLDIANRAQAVAKSAKGARDAATALSVETRCIKAVHDILDNRDRDSELDELAQQLAEMNAALAGKAGSAQREGVAKAPPIARGPRTVQ